VTTDNGPAYISGAHRIVCAELGIRHLRTRPYPAPHQRQSRTRHPNPAAPLGLRTRLQLKHRTHRSPHTLAQPLQLHFIRPHGTL